MTSEQTILIRVFLNMLSRFVIALLPRCKHLLISWLQSPSRAILEPKKTKSVIYFHVLKNRDIISLTKVPLVKAMVFPVVMYGSES